MDSSKQLALVFSLCAFWLAACASGEPFGEREPSGIASGAECEVNADCHDGDSSTLDTCLEGICHYESIPDTDPAPDTESEHGCQVDAHVDEDSELALQLEGVGGTPNKMLPLERGGLVGVAVRESLRLEVLQTEKPIDGLILVLLSDCANAAINRVAWGAAIDSPVLEPGRYYLGVFSEDPGQVVLGFRFVRPESRERGGDEAPESPGDNSG
ncbi:MAG: hypothetical protein R6V85_19390 [Polyangia bacterium]